MYDFSDYKIFELFRDFHYRNMTINKAEKKQNEFDGVLGALSVCSAKKKIYIETKNKLLDNAKKRTEKTLLKSLKMEYFC